MKNIFYIALLFTLLPFATKAQISYDTRTTNGFGNSQTTQQIKIIKSYPNPAISFITFEFQRSYNTGYSIEIYNLPGKRVAVANNLQNKTTVQLQNFYRGVYLFKLVDRTGKVIESGKFQVSN